MTTKKIEKNNRFNISTKKKSVIILKRCDSVFPVSIYKPDEKKIDI